MIGALRSTVLLASALHAAGVVAVAVASQYDYIVVGGGTAGLAVATRITQGLPYSTVLVIEAGEDGRGVSVIDVPGKKGGALGTKYDWNFTTVPQAAAKGRVFAQGRGKVLGGSSAINLLTYDRSSSTEYDGWEDLGNDGWNWSDMLHYLNKAENFTSRGTPYYVKNGVGAVSNGPVRGTINRVRPPQQDGWLPALTDLGVPFNKDYMSGDNNGVFYTSCSIDPIHYNRSYAANAYLPLAGPKLTILTSTQVEKVNFVPCSKGLLATGVTLTDGKVLNAAKEVILSAGSFLSPVILEASGIGNPSILGAAGIKTLINNPNVGENLQDHIRIQTSYQLKDNYTSIDALRYNTSFAAEQLELWNNGAVSLYDYSATGYTFQNWHQAIGNDTVLRALAAAAASAVPSPANEQKLEWMSDDSVPQFEAILSDGYTGVKGYPAVGSPLYGKDFFTIISVVQHPMSRGTVHINATNRLAQPIIDPKYLSSEYDVQAAISAVKLAREYALQPGIRETWVNEYEPGLDKVNTDAEWRDFVLNTTLTIYHPIGTCAMLPEEDGGVVDNKLVVYGTSNLRVVDASIMPVLISGHMQTTVYGIAEKAAQLIVHHNS